MSRGLFTRVNFLWIILVVSLTIETHRVKCHSCHEVKTAFQVRQIGPLKWVPETPGTDADLQVCKHQGPSCCTRKMEESYQVAVRRETVQNIRSYSFELNYLLLGHATAFQDTFQSLMTFSMTHISSLFESSYSSLSLDASPLITQLFSQLSLYVRGGNASVEASVHRFFDDLFPLVYGRLVNPGVAASLTGERLDCLRMTRQDMNPFGEQPQALARELGAALRAGRALTQALGLGMELMNATDAAVLTRDCSRALARMQYCSHCRGLTLIKPCPGYCLNVLRGCLASLTELNLPWRRHVALLEDLTHAVAGQHSLELALLGVEGKVNDAILLAQLHGPRLAATVDKVCGASTAEAPSSHTPTEGQVSTATATSPPASTPFSESPDVELRGRLAHLRREFVGYIPRYKTFFGALPEMLCEGEMGLEFTCWNGDDVVESYTKKVVGNGVHAQRQNPELKVRGADPALMEVKDRLEQFSQEIEESMPGLGHREAWVETGSGIVEGSGECDDEDGCQGSGDGTAHREGPDVSGGVVQQGSSPGSSLPERPPVVRVRGTSGASAAASPPSLLATLLLMLLLVPQ
ncbi:glypican-5 isoform X2 [Clupea harengus]|uniref:Glypican-5 isoform X2 n=1 Tax=Clupea harengus TaxID=7950 RepID=A0A6P8EU27_CLUHA|nr:glypican-5 isoform X2 [Clupea harengus]